MSRGAAPRVAGTLAPGWGARRSPDPRFATPNPNPCTLAPMAAHATRIFGQPTPENRGPSFAVSIALTAALFALAFGAMRSLPNLAIDSRQNTERPVVVQLPQVVLPETPTALTTERPESRARPTAPVSVPTTIAPANAIAPPITAPVTAPTGITSAPRDTNRAGTGKPVTAGDAALTNSLRPGSSGLGVPMAPAWTKSAEHVGNTAAIRDSILRTKMAAIPYDWKNHPPTGAEKAALETSQRVAAALQRRTTTAGSNEVAHPQGQGMNGVGAVGGPGIVTIDAPFLSSGPSRAQRKRNEAIDAEYQARLRGFQDLVRSLRDKRVADSVRLDSLRRDSLARRPKPPSAERSKSVADHAGTGYGVQRRGVARAGDGDGRCQ